MGDMCNMALSYSYLINMGLHASTVWLRLPQQHGFTGIDSETSWLNIFWCKNSWVYSVIFRSHIYKYIKTACKEITLLKKENMQRFQLFHHKIKDNYVSWKWLVLEIALLKRYHCFIIHVLITEIRVWFRHIINTYSGHIIVLDCMTGGLISTAFHR